MRPAFAFFATLLLAVLPSPSAHAATLPSGFAETQIAGGLASPTAMAFAPDGRVFVCEQGGRLRVVKNGALLSSPFVTLPVNSSGERGLLGVAFDPDFGSNQFVYVYYTTSTSPIHNRLSRFTADGDVALPGSEAVLLDLDNLSASNHNGGAIHFGPDNYLYVAVGENANGSNSQTLTNLLGKILRLDVSSVPAGIPTDNPFYDDATGNNRMIWAMGVRNPFTFSFQPGTGRMFINDVGETTWEEINDGIVGANYGWPGAEGPNPPGNPNFRYPLFSYGHGSSGTTGCAISGGAFYDPLTATFPASYIGDYFFADYCSGWIRKYDPEGGAVAGFATGISSPVDLRVSPDGALYYLARGSGSSTGVLFKVENTSNPAPQITLEPQSQTVSEGQPVTFSVVAAGSAPLSYRWQRDGTDLPGATANSYTLADPQLADSGAQFRCIVSNSFGTDTSNAATLTVTLNTAPAATITQPASGSPYSAGNTIAYAGNATDTEDVTLPASAFTWRVDFHHDTHTHPEVQPTTGAKSGSFTIPTSGETSANVWYRIHLTVQDSGGLSHSVYRDILPRTSTLTLVTAPSGLQLTLDGQPVTTPVSVLSVAGIVRSLGAVTPQTVSGTTWGFSAWSDGGAAVHNISTPLANTTYTATYATAPAPPTNLTATGGSGQVNLAWTDAASTETGFKIERSADGTSYTQIGTVGANVTSYANTGLPSATTYFYRVRANNGAGDSEYSNIAQATTTTQMLAAYDSTLKAPKCALVGVSCDSGTLLNGRRTLGPEVNQPNTINASCADGTSGSYHSDESNDRIQVSTTDGSVLAPGKTVRVDATVWADNHGSFSSDRLDLYRTANANSPSWTLIATLTPSVGGSQVLSGTYTLPSGALQAVRARFRFQGSASPCGTGSFDDHDDLVFAVGAGAPDFSVSVSPASVSLIQSGSGNTTTTVTSQNSFSSAVALSVSGLPSGVTAPFLSNPVTPPANGSVTSTLSFAASSTAATGTSSVTVTGTSGSLAHSTLLTLTVTATPEPDFGVSVSPGSVSVTQGVSANTTTTVTSLNGFGSAVGLSATGLPSGVTASFSPTPVTPPANGSTTSTLTLSASSTAATGTFPVTVSGTSGSSTHAVTLSLTVNPSGGTGDLVAAYDSTLKAPKCALVGVSCDSGTLLNGRGTVGPEVNQPNTVNGSCTDGTSGTFHVDESNDRIKVSTTDGSPLAAGKTVRVDATIWADSNGSFNGDRLDLYRTANANSPSWTLIATLTPSAGGSQVLSGTYTLPVGALQAVRARFRYQGSASSCGTGSYNDHDDLVFAVGAGAPDFSMSVAPVSVSLSPGGSGNTTVAIGSQGSFSSAVNLSVSGLPTGVTASFLPNPATPPGSGSVNSVLALTASSTAATGTFSVLVTGTSGSLTHSTALTLTVSPPGAITVFYDGAESATTSLTLTSTTSSTVWTRSTSSPYAGGYSWKAGSSTGGNYGNSGDARLTTPTLNLAGAASATLTYAFKYKTEANYDFFEVRISTSGGTNWTNLVRVSGQSTSYSAWAALASVNLNAYLGQTNLQIQFRFTTDGSVTDFGASVDEIRVVKQ